MFDGADVKPLCIGPLAGLVTGFLVYLVVAAFFGRKFGPVKDAWQPGLLFAVVIAPITCVAAFFIAGAVDDPYPWFKPTDSGIAGTYQLVPSRGESFKPPGNELVFDADGTFTMSKIPDYSSPPETWGTKSPPLMNGSGVWRVDKKPDTSEPLSLQLWIVAAEFRLVNDKADSRVMYFHIEGHLPPYQLIYTEDTLFVFVRQ